MTARRRHDRRHGGSKRKPSPEVAALLANEQAAEFLAEAMRIVAMVDQAPLRCRIRACRAEGRCHAGAFFADDVDCHAGLPDHAEETIAAMILFVDVIMDRLDAARSGGR